MIFDTLLQFSDAQAITADAASTNSIDLGTSAPNLGDGEDMALVVTVDVAADFTTGDEAYAIALQSDDNSGFSSATDIVKMTFTAAQLALNKQVTIPVPIGAVFERYLRVYYDVGGTTPTVTLTAFLQPASMIEKPKVYPKNYTIS